MPLWPSSPPLLQRSQYPPQCAVLRACVNHLATLTLLPRSLSSQRGAGALGGRMAVTKDQIVNALARVAAPDGRPLPHTGALSEIVATDGKVFFSINVDAAAVPHWEP